MPNVPFVHTVTGQSLTQENTVKAKSYKPIETREQVFVQVHSDHDSRVMKIDMIYHGKLFRTFKILMTDTLYKLNRCRILGEHHQKHVDYQVLQKLTETLCHQIYISRTAFHSYKDNLITIIYRSVHYLHKIFILYIFPRQPVNTISFYSLYSVVSSFRVWVSKSRKMSYCF